jgi:exodeoxyribonuclease V alpha subunit
MAESLKGVIERVTFHNLDSGFAVLRVQTEGRRGVVTVVGTLPAAVEGEFVEASGDWVQSRDHGQQFKAESLTTAPPSTIEGMRRYLGSGLVRGIGAHFARKIVETFGDKTFHVIDESPQFLAEIKGIGPKRIQQIRQSWQEQKAMRGILVFLHSNGIGTARAQRIYKTYGDQSIETVRQNPYRLASDIPGVGFRTADQLALRLGLDRNSPQRARAAISHVLREFSDKGHVGFPEEGVIAAAMEATQIGRDGIVEAVEEARRQDEVVRDSAALMAGKESGTGAADEPWLFLKPLFLAEQGVARLLHGLCAGPHPLAGIDISPHLARFEEHLDLKLAKTQRDAICAAAAHKVLVITGGPGVGKTTIVRGILDVFEARGLTCAPCASTGRAAKRLSESTGRSARTIHRLLEFDPGLGRFRRDRENLLEADLFVVDEASMVDVVLMNQLLRAIPARACLVIVGDIDQLPSVGPGSVLGDLIGSGAVPVIRLTEIFRQAAQSHIVRAAHAVNHGEEPRSAPTPEGDFFFVEAQTPQAIVERIITMIRERIPGRFGFDPVRDVQVLSPMNRTELGVVALNEQLRNVLNPLKPGTRQVERGGNVFREGDKVMQTSNNYGKEVFNGDIGRVRTIHEIDQVVVVEFDGRDVSYDFSELDELAPAFAVTIHKSQGSEYAAVIIPLHTQHYVMLQRNLLYTGITRGRKLVTLVGSRKALSIAVQRQDIASRYSLLQERLRRQAGAAT